MTRTTPWRGAIGCEGGPVIVADLADFTHWRGTEPLPNSERRELHLWSSFTSELPDHFHPNGPSGHQFIPAPNYAALEGMRDELFRFVADKWPGTVVTHEFERWIARRPDGAALNLEFDPTSEYDRCIRDLVEVKIHTFDSVRRCLVWSVQPGVVDIVRVETGQLVLVQTRYADDDEQAEFAVQRAIADAQRSGDDTDISFAMEHPTVVVAWAPNSYVDCRSEVLVDRDSATAPGLSVDFATDASGAFLGMLPGIYSVTTGDGNDERSGAAWCALTWREGPAQRGVRRRHRRL